MKFSHFSIPHDKSNHLVYGAAVAAGSLIAAVVTAFLLSLFGLQVRVHRRWLVAGAMLANLVVAAWTEWIYDAARPKTNTVDVRDFWATAAGGLLVCLPVLLTGEME